MTLDTTMVAMLLLALVCLGFRVLFVCVVPPDRLPPVVHRALTHLPPVVLAALVAVEVEGLTAGAAPPVAAYLLGAVLVVALIARHTRSLMLAIAAAAVACLALDLLLLA